MNFNNITNYSYLRINSSVSTPASVNVFFFFFFWVCFGIFSPQLNSWTSFQLELNSKQLNSMDRVTTLSWPVKPNKVNQRKYSRLKSLLPISGELLCDSKSSLPIALLVFLWLSASVQHCNHSHGYQDSK